MRYRLFVPVGALAVGMALSLAAADGASAAVVNATVTGSPLSFDSTNESGTITVSQFDTSLGTLQSIQISESGSENLIVSATNISGSTGGYTNVGGSGTLTLTTSGPAAFDIQSFLTAPSTSGSVAGNSTVQISQSGATSIANSEILTTNLGQYIGGGTYTVSLADSAYVLGNCPNPVFCGTSVTGNVDVTVAYDYIDAPAPTPGAGSAALLTAGLFGFVALRRSRVA